TRCALPLLLSLLFIYLSHTPPPTSEIYTLSLHDALPISNSPHGRSGPGVPRLALESRRRARRLPGTHARRGYRHLPHDPVAARRAPVSLVVAGGRGAARRAPRRRARLGGQVDRVAEAPERRQTGCAQQASLGPRVPGLAGSQERGGGARGLTARAPRTSVWVCQRRSSGLV